VGKVAVITGGGTGIGRAVALALDAEGWSVLVAGRRRDVLETLAAETDGRIVFDATDVRDERSVASLFKSLHERFGHLDLLFNNAGQFGRPAPIDETTLKDWRDTIEVIVTGTFLCTRAAVRLMKTQSPPGGRIINNGSISAHVPRPNSAPYTAAKHAITGLTKSTSLEGRAYSIACGQIDIGNAATELTAGIAQGAVQADGAVRAEPVIDVEHVARAVVYMATLPLEANVQFMTVMATGMPFIGRG